MDLNRAKEILTRETNSSIQSEDRKEWREVAEMGRRVRSERYFRARPCWALRTKMRTLKCIWSERGSQWSYSAMNVEMWDNRGRQAISLAAALSMQTVNLRGGRLPYKNISKNKKAYFCKILIEYIHTSCMYALIFALYMHPFIHCIVFIHFYRASHSMSLSEALLTTAIDTVSEFTHWSATGNCKWRTCPSKVPTWRLEWNSNPRPFGRKASTLLKGPPRLNILYMHALSHWPQTMGKWYW